MVTPFDYLNLGWKIFPVHMIDPSGYCTCREGPECESPGKHGRTRHGVKDATSDPAQVSAWMNQFPNTNWGLACGQDSGILVLDIDVSKGGGESFDEFQAMIPDATPPTLVQNTGGGGKHLIYRLPDENVRIGNPTNWLAGVDIRGNNGHIVVEPSGHVSGGRYTWANWGADIAVAPEKLIDAIIGKRKAGGATGFTGGGIGGAAGLDDTEGILSGVKEGSRDDTIFRLACRLRRQLNDSRTAVEVLVMAAADAAVPPFPRAEAMKKVDQAFAQDHSESYESIFTVPDDSGDSGDNVPSVTEDGVPEEAPLYRLTDMGNRDRFIQAFGDDYRYVVGLGWHRWSDMGWHKVDDLRPHRDAQRVPDMVRQDAQRVADISTRNRFAKWANDSESAGRINSIMTLAKGHPKVMKSSDEFNGVEYELACRNGMVNLRDGSIRPFVRNDLFTRNTGVIYEPDFVLPQWEKFLLETTQGDQDLIDYLQMAAGYSLTGSVAEEAFFIISGPPASGKSTYMDGLLSAMGGYVEVTAAETFMRRFGGKEAPREELIKFNASRIISTSELPEGERFDEAFMKRITGGDPISVRMLYQEAFTIQPQFKLWMATNHDPVTSDSAMFRRIKRVPFLYTVPEERRDRTLKEMVKNPQIGGKAVLAWAVRGAIKYYEEGRLETPTVIEHATRTYQVAQDSFLHFLAETFWMQDGVSINIRIAYEAYSDWCKRSNERPVRRPIFIQKLTDKGVKMFTDDRGDMHIADYVFRTDVPELQLLALQTKR